MAPDAGRPIAFSVEGPVARGDLAGFFMRMCALVERRKAEVAWCDVRRVHADAVTVEALARVQLVLHRYGCRLRLLNASPDLVDLITFMGLRDVLLARARH